MYNYLPLDEMPHSLSRGLRIFRHEKTGEQRWRSVHGDGGRKRRKKDNREVKRHVGRKVASKVGRK
jgi:hypothetical protein